MASIVSTLAVLLDLENSDGSLSSGSDDDIDLFILSNFLKRSKRKNRGNITTSILNTYSLQEFQNHFKMSRTTFELIFQRVILQIMDAILENPKIYKEIINAPGIKKSIAQAEKDLLICLWVLVTQECFRSIAQRFQVPEGFIFNSTVQVCKAIVKTSSRYISWPSGSRVNEVIEGFQAIAHLPGVLGIIDTLHINTKSSVHSSCNRNILQAVCNHNNVFTSCYISRDGSKNNQSVFWSSDLFLEIEGNIDIFPHNSHLLGSVSYCLQPYLMTPYLESKPCTDMHIMYNQAHAKTRAVIRTTFALLQGRFLRLQHLEVWRIDIVPLIITTCCILHNICQLQHDNIEQSLIADYITDLDFEVADLISASGYEKRDHLAALIKQSNQ